MFVHSPGASRRESADLCLSPIFEIELDHLCAWYRFELNRQAQQCKITIRRADLAS
jgi:hypothetical protein